MGSKSQNNAYVLGVGLTPFLKPRGERMYNELGYEAGIKAMLDANVTYDDVEVGIACFCYGSTTSGQRIFYQFGMSSIPIYNTNNACATGSTGLQLARTMVSGNGVVDCALVIGFEQMERGSIKSKWDDRPPPTDLSLNMMNELRGVTSAPPTAQWFANAGLEYMEKFGATADDFAEIARISHEHSSRNPYSQFRDVYTKQQILDSPMIQKPLTKLQCSPTSDGAAAAVVVSEKFLQARPYLRKQAVLIAGQSLMTDSPKLYSRSDIELVGFEMTAKAAKAAMKEAGTSPSEIKVVELHDCFSTNELITIDGLGFCEPGKAHEMVRRGDITYGGNGIIVNPSGGLISKGHPIGATGIAQCAELTWHLRGWATNRAVKGTSVTLQHNLGLGGAVVVTVYKRADGKASPTLSNEDVIKNSAFSYNPAIEARGISPSDAEKVRSKKYSSEWALGDVHESLNAKL